MELKWVTTLREHGDAYSWCKADLERVKQDLHADLARTNPEKPYTVAALQGQIKLLEDLLQQITTEERKELADARRQAVAERRVSGQLRRVKTT